MLVAGCTALLLNYVALRQADQRVPVAVAARDVEAGEALRADDLRFVDLRAGDDVLATLVTRNRAATLAGRVAATGLAAGALLRVDDLRPAAAAGGARAMSIPVEPEHAVAGRLQAGDRVDVVEVRDGRAAYLLTGAPVLAVAGADQRSGLTGSRSFSVTVAVDDAQALRLALAIREGHLEIVHATGAPPPRAEEFRPAARAPAGDRGASRLPGGVPAGSGP